MVFPTKLTPEQKKEIVELYEKTGLKQKDLADKFHVSTILIKKVLRKLKKADSFDDKAQLETKPVLQEQPKDIPRQEEPKQEEQNIFNMEETKTQPQAQEIKPAQAVEEKKTEDLDPNKDYCSKCYGSGKVTEITRQNSKCPVCGCVLAW